MTSRKTLLWLSGFIALGAYFGALMMFVSPDGSLFGLDPILPYMQCLPFAEQLFQNFVFSGIMLIVVNGICNTIAFVGLLRKWRYGVLCALLAGVMLLCWLAVQWVIFDFNLLTTLYTVFGIAQVWLAVADLRATVSI